MAQCPPPPPTPLPAHPVPGGFQHISCLLWCPLAGWCPLRGWCPRLQLFQPIQLIRPCPPVLSLKKVSCPCDHLLVICVACLSKPLLALQCLEHLSRSWPQSQLEFKVVCTCPQSFKYLQLYIFTNYFALGRVCLHDLNCLVLQKIFCLGSCIVLLEQNNSSVCFFGCLLTVYLLIH